MSWFVDCPEDSLDSPPEIKGNVHTLRFTCSRCGHKQEATVIAQRGVIEIVSCQNTEVCGDEQCYVVYDPEDPGSVQMKHHGVDDVPLKDPVARYVDVLVKKSAELESAGRPVAARISLNLAIQIEAMSAPEAKQAMQAMGLIASPLG